MEGYIKLFRKSIESSVFQNANLWQVWCYCLMRANHKKTKILWNKKEIVLREGQFITGRFQGSEDCKMNPNTFYLQLKTLEKLNNISINPNNKNSVITIINWASYQCVDGTDNNKITTEQQQNNTDKNDNNDKKKNRAKKISYSVESIPIGLNGQLFYKNDYFYITTDLKNELLKNIIGLTEDRLLTEFYVMQKWLEKNGKKKDYQSFIVRWLSKNSKEKSKNGHSGKITDGIPELTGDVPGWL